MSDPNNQNHVSVELRIKSVDYYLSMLLVDNDQKLVLELGDMQSADTWKGVFEASCTAIDYFNFSICFLLYFIFRYRRDDQKNRKLQVI